MIELNKYMIPATEGLFSKIREKREAAKRESAEKHENFLKFYKQDFELLKKVIQKVISSAKKKWPKLPYNILIHDNLSTDELWVDVNIFKDEWVLNEYDENYIPEAPKCFDYIYDTLESEIEKETGFKLQIKQTVIENNIVSFKIYP